jgi:hypothetical protein
MAGCGGLEFVVSDKRLELGVACHYSGVPAKSDSNRQARVILIWNKCFTWNNLAQSVAWMVLETVSRETILSHPIVS